MSKEREIKFKYIFDENYNPVYCNGAYGGISTHGEIVANFFFERLPIPNSITNLVSENGQIVDLMKTDPDNLNDIVIRHVLTGIVLNEESARSIHSWLGIQLAELDARKAMASGNNE